MLRPQPWSSGIAARTCAAMRLLNKFVVLAAALAGCTSGPDFVRPDKPKVQGYTPENLAPQTAASAVADGFAVIPAEIGYRLEVWHQAAGEPYQLDVAL